MARHGSASRPDKSLRGHAPASQALEFPELEDTRRWLADQGFSPGPVFTSDDLLEASPWGVEDMKTHRLEDLIGRAAMVPAWAYGNASTDICAYARAGFEPDATYIIGTHGGNACAGHGPTHAIASYEEHFADLDGLEPAWP